MSEFDYVSSVDLEDWWEDLTIEQRRAAYEAWQRSTVKSIPITTDNTTHSQVRTPTYTKHYDPYELPVVAIWKPHEKSDKELEHDEIRKQLASKIVWDQDRFK